MLFFFDPQSHFGKLPYIRGGIHSTTEREAEGEVEQYWTKSQIGTKLMTCSDKERRHPTPSNKIDKLKSGNIKTILEMLSEHLYCRIVFLLEISVKSPFRQKLPIRPPESSKVPLELSLIIISTYK